MRSSLGGVSIGSFPRRFAAEIFRDYLKPARERVSRGETASSSRPGEDAISSISATGPLAASLGQATGRGHFAIASFDGRAAGALAGRDPPHRRSTIKAPNLISRRPSTGGCASFGDPAGPAARLLGRADRRAISMDSSPASTRATNLTEIVRQPDTAAGTSHSESREGAPSAGGRCRELLKMRGAGQVAINYGGGASAGRSSAKLRGGYGSECMVLSTRRSAAADGSWRPLRLTAREYRTRPSWPGRRGGGVGCRRDPRDSIDQEGTRKGSE